MFSATTQNIEIPVNELDLVQSTDPILSYDPLVGDTLCHIRAVYLAYLFQKNSNIGLTKEERRFLEFSNILNQSRLTDYDEFGVISFEATYNKNDLKTIFKKNISNTKMDDFIVTSKKHVATAALIFLFEQCQEMIFTIDKNSIKRDMALSGKNIPVIHFYYSVKMMLYSTAMLNLPLIVNLRRLYTEKDGYLLQGGDSLVYRYNKQNAKFTLQEKIEDGNEAGVLFDMVSLYVKQDTPIEEAQEKCEPDKLGKLEKYGAFIQCFKELDITQLIMLCATSHSPYPKIERSINREELPDKDVKVIPAESEGKIRLNLCSSQEQDRMIADASKYGFFRDKSDIYIQANKEKQQRIRTNKTYSLFVDHVSAARIQDSAIKMVELLTKCKNLTVPRTFELHEYQKCKSTNSPG